MWEERGEPGPARRRARGWGQRASAAQDERTAARLGGPPALASRVTAFSLGNPARERRERGRRAKAAGRPRGAEPREGWSEGGVSGGGEAEKGARGRTAGPPAASPDSPPAAAPRDSSAPPGGRRRGWTPGRGGCREPVPRATGPAPPSDSGFRRGLERQSCKWRRAGRGGSDASSFRRRGRGFGSLSWDIRRLHGWCVRRATSPGGAVVGVTAWTAGRA